MEIYANTLANVDLIVPVAAINGTFTVKAYDGDTLLYTFPTVAAITGGYRVTLPFSLVQYDRSFKITWSFSYTESFTTKTYTHDTYVNVVTPYVTLDDIREAIPEAESLSDYELARLEKRIRGVVDGYTGQTFGKFSATRDVIGAGDEELKLDKRLAVMTNITGANILYDTDGVTAAAGYYTVRGDGWFVGFTNPIPDGDYVFENVISAPDSCFSRLFKDNVVYTITGTWGWESIPSNVKEAMLILCEDELCPQAEYRDRYLKSISGDGWRYEYNPNAYYGTGSVIADQLLEEFRYSTMTVI